MLYALGGIFAASLATQLFGPGHGAHILSVATLHAVGMEAVLSFFLMLVIFAPDTRVSGAASGLAIVLMIVVDVFMNHSRSLSPILLGAVRPTRVYEALRGSEDHVQQAPNDLVEALQEIENTV